ncbi:hypothetical protein [Chroococcidiopsis sp. CCNUC1]|uniref:hypothetical protein n=1 Tax=Chroococcidiopsis sp. CCNUC1 TaxID=2653189 RepID=UPI002021F085|nr:hypothetical protein [Chroococcidiopsis sp. CCNUC1]URD53612.1 hypothetical protein M5J74_30040 [Chroococcidiopsis sp. CCNUC1]
MSKSTARKTRAKRALLQEPVRKARAIPDKCLKCATLSAEQAQAIHGVDGDRCWNPAVCYSRRSHARHRDRRNSSRNQKRSRQLEQIEVETEATTAQFFAVLVVYRASGTDTPIHAIGAEIWQGQQKYGEVKTIRCGGMTPSQVHAYVKKMLSVLSENYGIKKFAAQERLDPQLCPVQQQAGIA